jgi:uncharacterized protein (TIGR02270 family)
MSASGVQRWIGFRPWEISALVNREVVEQHAGEAAFLWTQRDNAVRAPHYSLKDLAGLDERVEAHLDGLRVAGQIGWGICDQALGQQEPDAVFAAALLAFESQDAGRVDKVLNVGCSELALQRPLISALGWLEFDQAKRMIDGLLTSPRPEVRRVGIGASAVHRKDPGPPLGQAILDPDIRLRGRAIKACGELGRIDLLPMISRLTSDSDEVCRFFAAWSAARLGDRSNSVFAVLRESAEARGRYAERALAIALRCMSLGQAKAWHRKLRDSDDHLRLAAIGAGVAGDPGLVSDLLGLMELDEVKRIAGEAFSMITGVDLAYADLDGEPPEGFESGPSEEPGDEEVEMDPDEDLPWPEPELVKKWWQQHQGEFRPGARYLRGKEITPESLKDALISGNQRQRAAAALELGIRQPTQSLFEVRARGKKQLKRLDAWTS